MQFKTKAFFACAVASIHVFVTAAPISTKPNLIIFGNSLSDNGNAAELRHTDGFWEGRWSNSYVWDEYTAKILDMKLVNRAYSGATSNNKLSPAIYGNITIPSFHDQVNTWLKTNPNPSQYNLENDVIEIEIGSNDVLYSVTGLVSGAIDISKFATRLSDSIMNDIRRLLSAGYKNIVLWNLPAIEYVPSVNSLGASSLVKPIIGIINSAIKGAINKLIDEYREETQGIHLFDLNTLIGLALLPTSLQALGITDSTGVCYVKDSKGGVIICDNPDEHFFYDSVHPASRMHYLWGIVAAILTRDPNATIDANEIIRLAKIYNIGESDRNNNIIINGNLTPSEMAVIPALSSTVPKPTATAKCR
ncbi:hypothetical protein COEREDRAFT_5534 [Coemansia reversa NRRL 1564]|uniref:SGNH hydrolase n=1 Tax=Coemansia reversa (strain ATCC 12441 / NRRL 1564) TaxID=763665 RepID=A0A2G5BL43_COERN|nr:hypothetical protein COEREDRAFT_5534 [Coemansia reversa NRRL 1564]|eukprot:PIA19723.1 hypothetical protein COEREDRAFT_5534 [Coemansia reversa NRRL 1564]